MILEPYFTKCLAQGTYYISSGNEAVVIDPLRDVQQYVDRAHEDNAIIKYIFLTHFHADFVSGHVDLAQKTGATIVIGPNAETSYAFAKAEHHQVFTIGDITLMALHTPGHTLESTCYLLKDSEGKEQALFTGDTLFIGDVGRPDLAAKSDMSTDDLAGLLYNSLHNIIMRLPDHIRIYPAHVAGSAFGKNMSSENNDSLGHQKATNYALAADLSKADFIKGITTGITTPPAYFPMNVQMNRGVNSSIDEVLKRGLTSIKPNAFKTLAEDDEFLVLDVRTPQEFTAGHIPGSWFIGLDGQFAPWAGALIKNIDQKIVLVTPPGREEEAVTRLARVGYDNVNGYLMGGFEAWKSAEFEIDIIENMSAENFVDGLQNNLVENPLDVRELGEYETSHLKNVPLNALDDVHDHVKNLATDKKYHVHCAGDYKSVIFASIAQSHGIENMINIKGGYGAIEKVAPSTLLQIN
jgi:glyoxylase-like metal-dependent hydrolase (beta-lactamase superfamily II)/rhodanese-related sulfurtransferase